MEMKKIKLISFVLILIFAFAIFLFFMFKSYDYQKKYSINKYQILEKYNKKKKYYIFNISIDKVTYPYIIKSKYFNKKELITQIKEFTSGEETCIIPISKEINFFPLCYNGEYLYMLNSSKIENIPYKYKDVSFINKEYNNIKINALANLSLVLFNYRGFYLINKNGYKTIDIFNKDVYSMNLIYQEDNMLIIPDYNEDYFFKKFYLINLLDGNIKEIKTDYNISFDSIFLGSYKGNIYLLDKKEKKEYKINIRKRNINLVNYQVLENGKLVEKSFKEINNNNLKFLKENIINYEIIENNLYMVIGDINIKITDKIVSRIIKNDDDTIYYLVQDNLYMFNNVYGEVLIVNNFEWNFNNVNMMFIS